MRILGIDPGTATVGYGVVQSFGGGGKESLEYVASGIISTSKNHTTGNRLAIIRTDILCLIDEYVPDMISIEALFFFKNAKTLVPVAQARGVILEAAACRDLPTFEYTPMQVKLHLTGYGRADKHQVQVTIAQLLRLPEIIKPDDASDALAIAVCHARMCPSIHSSAADESQIDVASTMPVASPALSFVAEGKAIGMQ